MDDDHSPKVFSPVFVTILGIMSAALVVTVYHCVVITLCRRGRRQGAPHRAQPDDAAAEGLEDVSSARLVPPTATYGKDEGMVGGVESTCAVCLCDFKDGEQVRLLPECMHYYHVPCIDRWLLTHTSCPLCRADATPSPGRRAAPRRPPESGRTPGSDE